MKTILFLDLEETVIRSWFNPHPINIKRVKHFVSQFSIDEVGIFSFAISGKEDKKFFIENMKNDIESILTCNITDDLIMTLDILKRKIAKSRRMASSLMKDEDFFGFFNKEMSFLEFAPHFQNTHLILLDDTVRDLDIKMLKNNNTLTIRNIKNI